MTRNTTRSRSAAGRAAILILILALSSAVEARRAAATDTDAGGHLRRRDRAAGTAGTAATADARRRRRRRRRRAEDAAEIVEDGEEGPTMADQVEAIMAPSSTDEGSSEAATMANMVAMQRRQDIVGLVSGGRSRHDRLDLVRHRETLLSAFHGLRGLLGAPPPPPPPPARVCRRRRPGRLGGAIPAPEVSARVRIRSGGVARSHRRRQGKDQEQNRGAARGRPAPGCGPRHFSLPLFDL